MADENITKEEILKRLDELEGEKLRDTHLQVHRLVVDFFFEHFNLTEKKKGWLTKER